MKDNAKLGDLDENEDIKVVAELHHSCITFFCCSDRAVMYIPVTCCLQPVFALGVHVHVRVLCEFEVVS